MVSLKFEVEHRREAVSAKRSPSSPRLWAAILVMLAWSLVAARPAVAEPKQEKKSQQAAPGQEHASKGEKKHSAMEHVLDAKYYWHFFDSFPPLPLPEIFPGFRLTKFMILEVIAAVLIAAIYIPLARRLANGQLPTGTWDNLFEVLLTFVRDEMAKPAIGEHDGDQFVPFLWTLFLFILVNNLLGMIPFAGSATASIYVTGALALCVFFALHGSGIAKMGLRHYVLSLVPHLDAPLAMKIILVPMIFALEWMGVIIRNVVLAIRLFANMFAGHMVLATILMFIVMAAKTAFALWAVVTISSIAGVIALSLLEIFVAFLQTYIFVFLAALFIGIALHPQH